MAGSRRGPALSELFEPPATGRVTKAPSRPAAVTTPSTVGTSGAARSVPRPVEASPTAAPDAPLFRFDGGRANLSLTSTSAAGVVFVAGMVLCGVYLFGFHRGRGFGQAEGVAATRLAGEDEIARRRASAADPRLTEGLRTPPRDSGAAPRGLSGPATGNTDAATLPGGSRGEVAWVRGNNYVVVQGFLPGAADDAVTAQDFLARQGVATEVVSRSDGGCWLITTQGFNLDDPAQGLLAEALRERVRSIGGAFRAAGGRYDFQSCYLMKLKGDGW